MWWVRECYRHSGRTVGGASSDSEVEAFLLHIQSRKADWQVGQAREAIHLYRHLIRAPIHRKPSAFEQMPHQWAEAEKRMIASSRLKHRSYATEKFYRFWVRSFGAALGGKPIDLLDTDDVRRYLSDLATQRRVSASTQYQALGVKSRLDDRTGCSPFGCRARPTFFPHLGPDP